MDSLKQFFSFMNDISFKYVVLRNWDSLPYDVQLGEHSDLDILVYDQAHFFEIFQQAKLEYLSPRVRTRIPIDDSYLYIDVRYVGDDYYPIDFEQAILNTREWNPRGFFTPNPIHHRIALAYHAVHHKDYIAKEYKQWLGDATKAELLKALIASNIGWIEPKDKSVGKFNGYWKGATSIVETRGDWVLKKQVSYLDHPLIKNEYEILRDTISIHFPMVKMEGDDLLVENCGSPLTVANIPMNWEAQLRAILIDLNINGIQHRDIKLDNLMVKNECIMLLDFGWASTSPLRGGEFEKLENNPPSCLGFPNKPSTGFSDEYSMRCVFKQIDCMIEDKVMA